MTSNRRLTEFDKAQIWKYHHQNPLVTHSDIAAFFKIERSTVSKIVHHDQYQFNAFDAVEPTLPRMDVRTALQSWSEENVLNGIPPTRPMIRKKAAILGASAWLQDNGGSSWDPEPGTREWQSASSIGEPTPNYCFTPSESIIAFSDRPETEISLISEYKSVDSQTKPQEDPLLGDLTARHESVVLLQPVASSGCSKDTSAPSPMPTHQETSTCIYVSEQTDLCVWDAFDVLKRRLLETTNPTTSDLLSLSHLEDRLRHLFPKK